MPGRYPDHEQNYGVPGYGKNRTLGGVLRQRAEEYMQLPSDEEVLKYFNIRKPQLNSLADYEEWSRRMDRLKVQMMQAALDPVLVEKSVPPT